VSLRTARGPKARYRKLVREARWHAPCNSSLTGM
jgi:hypothetical protein